MTIIEGNYVKELVRVVETIERYFVGRSKTLQVEYERKGPATEGKVTVSGDFFYPVTKHFGRTNLSSKGDALKTALREVRETAKNLMNGHRKTIQALEKQMKSHRDKLDTLQTSVTEIDEFLE